MVAVQTKLAANKHKKIHHWLYTDPKLLNIVTKKNSLENNLLHLDLAIWGVMFNFRRLIRISHVFLPKNIPFYLLKNLRE